MIILGYKIIDGILYRHHSDGVKEWFVKVF